MLQYVACNLCGANATTRVAHIDSFDIVRCKQCGLVYVNPRFSPDTLQQIYTEDYYCHDGINNGCEFFGYNDYLADEANIKITFSKRLNTIERYAVKGKLLDVGCAAGFFLDLARARGWDVTGTEVSAFSARYAREQLGLDVRLGALSELGFRSTEFSAVTMWDVIEHLPDPLAELREVNRILQPDGLFSIITPDVGSLMARVLGSRWEEFRRVREHVYFFSRRTITALLEKAGFEVLKIESADKVFYLGPAIHRLKYYTWDGIITDTLARLVYRLRLDKVRINVNPMTKMTVYARKLR